MNSRRLHSVLTRFRASFVAAFPAITPQDLDTILCSPSETLLDLLQTRYGYTRTQAKTAWNDFVLTHVDGREDDPSQPGEPDGRSCAAYPRAPHTGHGRSAGLESVQPEPYLWRILCLGWGRPSASDPQFRVSGPSARLNRLH